MDNHLIMSDEAVINENYEGQIFYLKMKGDYLRYKAEVAGKEEKESKYFGALILVKSRKI